MMFALRQMMPLTLEMSALPNDVAALMFIPKTVKHCESGAFVFDSLAIMC